VRARACVPMRMCPSRPCDKALHPCRSVFVSDALPLALLKSTCNQASTPPVTPPVTTTERYAF